MNLYESSYPVYPLVSVVVTTYNRSQLVHRAIRSVLAQTYPSLDIIVIDDASSDDTMTGIEKAVYGDQIRYIKHDRNLGLATARNTGLRLAKGEYVSYLDDDDEWVADKIAKQVSKARETSDCHEVICSACWFMDNYGRSKRKTFIDGNIKEAIGKNGLSVLPYDTGLLLKQALLDIGGYDETLRSHTEYAVWMRMAEKGYSAACVNEPLVMGYQHDCGHLTEDVDSRLQNTQLFLEKWSSAWVSWYGEARAVQLRREFVRNVNIALAEKLASAGNMRPAFHCYANAIGSGLTLKVCHGWPVVLSLIRVCLRRIKLYGLARSAWHAVRPK